MTGQPRRDQEALKGQGGRRTRSKEGRKECEWARQVCEGGQLFGLFGHLEGAGTGRREAADPSRCPSSFWEPWLWYLCKLVAGPSVPQCPEPSRQTGRGQLPADRSHKTVDVLSWHREPGTARPVRRQGRCSRSGADLVGL